MENRNKPDIEESYGEEFENDLIFSKDEDEIGLESFLNSDEITFDTGDDDHHTDEEDAKMEIFKDEKIGNKTPNTATTTSEDNNNLKEVEEEIEEPFESYNPEMNLSRNSKNRIHPYLLGSNNGVRLRMIISELQVMIDESRLELDDLKVEYKSTKRKLVYEQTRVLSLEQKIENYQDLEEYKNSNRIEDLRGEKLNEIVEKYDRLRLRNREVINEKNELEKKYLQLIKRKDFTIKSSETEIKRLTTQLTETNTLLESRGNKIEQLKTKIFKLKNDRKGLSEIQSTHIFEKEKEIEDLKKENLKIKEERIKYRRIQSTNSELLKTIENSKKEKRKLEIEIQNKNIHISDLESQFNDLNLNNRNSSQIHQNSKYFYENEIQKLKSDVLTEQTTNEKLKLKIRKLKSDIENSKNNKDQNTHIFDTLRREIEELKTKNKKLEINRNKEINKSINKIKQEQEEHIHNICKKLLIEKKEIADEISKTKKKLSLERSKIKDQSTKLNHSKKIIDSLQKTLRLEENKASSLLVELRSEKEKSVLIESKYLNKNEFKNTELEKKIIFLENENERLKNEIELEKNESMNTKVSRKKYNSDLKKVIRKFNKQKEWIRRARQKHEDSNSKIKFLEIEFNRLNKTVGLKEKQINHLNNVLSYLKKENEDNLKAKI